MTVVCTVQLTALLYEQCTELPELPEVSQGQLCHVNDDKWHLIDISMKVWEECVMMFIFYIWCQVGGMVLIVNCIIICGPWGSNSAEMEVVSHSVLWIDRFRSSITMVTNNGTKNLPRTKQLVGISRALDQCIKIDWGSLWKVYVLHQNVLLHIGFLDPGHLRPTIPLDIAKNVKIDIT